MYLEEIKYICVMVIWIIFILALIGYGVLSLALVAKQNKMRKAFISSLDDHDKALILEYIHIKPSLKDLNKD